MNTFKYIKIVIRDEIKAMVAQFRETKMLFMSFLICLFGVVMYLDPFPDRNIHIATSYKDSDWYEFGINASAYLEKNGLKVSVVTTHGAVENVNRLFDPKDPVNAAFSYGMALTDEQRKAIYSLGSIDYEPVWIFYNEQKVKDLKNLHELGKYKTGVGPKQSGSYVISKILLQNYGIDIEHSKNFVSNAFLVSADKFVNGELDALIVVSSVADPIVQKLIRMKGIGLYSFENVSAFEKKFNSLEAVKLPAGSINVYPAIPAKDMALVATTTSLVVKRDMHPDLQLALLMASKQMNRNSENLFFAKRDEFPAYVDPMVPISPVASKFYDYGPPQVMRYLPFWIAGFVDRAWLFLLTLVAIFYPLSKLNIHIRKLRFVVHERPHYEELLEIDALISSKELTPEEKESISERLNHIGAHASKSGVPIGEEAHYFDLVNAIYLLRRKLEATHNSKHS